MQTPLQCFSQQLFRPTNSSSSSSRGGGGGVIGGGGREGGREGGTVGGHDGPGGEEFLSEAPELLLESFDGAAGVFVDDGLVFDLGEGGREGGREGKRPCRWCFR